MTASPNIIAISQLVYEYKADGDRDHNGGDEYDDGDEYDGGDVVVVVVVVVVVIAGSVEGCSSDLTAPRSEQSL